MRWVLVATGASVLFAWMTYQTVEFGDDFSLPHDSVTVPPEPDVKLSVADETQPSEAVIANGESASKAFELTPEESEVIRIGAFMDPEDPSTWPQQDDAQTIIIGEPKDSEDPSSWPQAEETEVLVIGESMDSDDPMTWTSESNPGRLEIGAPKDLNDPVTWEDDSETAPLIIGEPKDADDPP